MRVTNEHIKPCSDLRSFIDNKIAVLSPRQITLPDALHRIILIIVITTQELAKMIFISATRRAENREVNSLVHSATADKCQKQDGSLAWHLGARQCGEGGTLLF